MISEETYVALLVHIDELIRDFELHPDEAARERVFVLLKALDAVHREGLQRLVATLREFSGDALVERVCADPVTRKLLGLYDLAELDLPELKRPAGFVPLEQLGAARPK